jgi:hypothetical protein
MSANYGGFVIKADPYILNSQNFSLIIANILVKGKKLDSNL